jgi:hypothetical protein
VTRNPVEIRIKYVLLAALLSVTICACAGNAEKKPEENIYPADYKTQVVDLLRRQLDNSKGVRDAYIAEPVLKTPRTTPRYVACMRFNAADGSGQYAGAKEMAAFFFAGKITQIVDAGPELCGNSAYQRFIELQNL